jgi:hypothetical protein
MRAKGRIAPAKFSAVVRTIGHVFGLFKAQMPDHEESALMGTDSQRVRFLNE